MLLSRRLLGFFEVSRSGHSCEASSQSTFAMFKPILASSADRSRDGDVQRRPPCPLLTGFQLCLSKETPRAAVRGFALPAPRRIARPGGREFCPTGATGLKSVLWLAA